MSERWVRAEQLDEGTVVDTEVTIRPNRDDMVTVEAAVVRRFLREAGYEEANQ